MVHVTEKQFFVRINAGPGKGGNPVVYLNKGLSFETFTKWLWYFEYRAALYKVNNPRFTVHFETGSYIAEPDTRIKRLNDLITAQRRKISEYETKLRMAEQTWSQLFSIAEEPMYKKAVAKIEYYKNNLNEYIDRLAKLEA